MEGGVSDERQASSAKQLEDLVQILTLPLARDLNK